MSKAEDFAIKKYPVSIEDILGHKIDVNLWQRKACAEGYRQAEKDLELTWEDMEKVFDLCYEVLRDVYLMKFPNDKEEQKEFYQEVLKRFKERKEK